MVSHTIENQESKVSKQYIKPTGAVTTGFYSTGRHAHGKGKDAYKTTFLFTVG